MLTQFGEKASAEFPKQWDNLQRLHDAHLVTFPSVGRRDRAVFCPQRPVKVQEASAASCKSN